MRKILSTAVLIFGLLSSSHANAYDASFIGQVLQLAQETITAVKTAATAAAAEVTAATTELMAAFDKVAHSEVMEQMAKDYQHAQDIADEANELITGYRDLEGGLANGVYKYKKEDLPDLFTPTVICRSGDGRSCIVAGIGYRGAESASNSRLSRNNWKIDPATVGLGNTIQQISAAAAESNAQELAVIQAMAQEAYVVINNRIAMIEDLKNQINSPKNPSKDDAKYIANLQAQLQSQQALLGNEQNKLTALAILQQSQRDAYEQRKREIASYVVNGDADNHTVGRALISTVQKSAYATVAAAYK